MANQARTWAATAAGVALAAGAFCLALSPSRDVGSLTAAAKMIPVDPAVELGLAESPTMALALCFDPGSNPSPEIMAIVNQIIASGAGDNGTDFNTGSSWSGSPGSPASTLTWSFVPDGTQVPGLSTGTAASNLFSSMDAKFGNRATWIAQVQSCLDRWAAISGISYQRVTNNGNDWDDGAAFPNSGASSTPGSTRGHVRIGARNLDGGSNVLAFNYFPTNGDMVIDSSENWQNSSNSYRFLRNTLTHEMGHGIGLGHVCPGNSTKLMEPLLATAFDGPQQDDIRGSHKLYGDQYESNNSFGSATNLGTVATNVTINPSVITNPSVNNASLTSIDRLADVDFFKFTINAPATLSATLIPRGTTYLDGPQNSNGSCSAGTNTNALAAADLNLQVMDTNGVSVLATAPAAPAGGTETLSSVTLDSAGTYYIRVGATSSTSPQLYQLSFSVSSSFICPQFTDQPVDQSVCSGEAIILFANGIGTPQPTFQWRKNGNPLPGQTDNTLFILSASTSDQGTYDCVATNSCGSDTSSPAVVTVTAPPAISQHPSNQTVNAGSPVSFSVTASPAGVTYQWTKNGQNIQGATGSTYSIASAASGDQGTYACAVSNTCNTITSNPANLTVNTGTPCYANCDGSTSAPVLNVLDFNCFLNRFNSGDPYANCDGSTSTPQLNVLDFNCFLNQFSAGCN